ncbi:NAD(P)/FAD-dependent oxidoreductase [Streptomyces sp. NPDC017529]|uniref:NAD(P)/FAD-dependent oxidoreductase n=1 Tax=Streptomyces sp. NPDC017529 TaxID=3365000 RepID=UPI00379D7486
MSRPDIAVVGSGPAGCATAWHLATAGADVVLVDDGRRPWAPVGQQLSSAALRVLRTMGVADQLATITAPVTEARSAWTDTTLAHRPALFNPYGPPLAVSRATFDALLQEAARNAGARVLRAHIKAAPGPGGWRLTVRAPQPRTANRQTPPPASSPPGTGGPIPVLIDATGAARAISRGRLHWTSADRLRCATWRLPPKHPEPFPWSLVEADAPGWWYSAPEPGAGQLTVIHARQHPVHTTGAARPGPPPHTAARLGTRRLPRPGTERVADVGSADPPWTDSLLAVGDAAMAPDPLSASGLRHALELAGPAATAAIALLNGDTHPATAYTELVRTAYTRHLHQRRLVHAAATPAATSPPGGP